MGRLSGFFAVPLGDKFRLLLAAVLLYAIRIGIVLVPFSGFRRAVLALASLLSRLVPGSPDPVRVAWAVDAADRSLPGHRTCLMRSLTAETVHRLYEHDIVHRIGVAKSDGDGDCTVSDSPVRTAAASDADAEFEAHSWIESDGEIIIGRLEDLSRFHPLPPLNESEIEDNSVSEDENENEGADRDRDRNERGEP